MQVVLGDRRYAVEGAWSQPSADAPLDVVSQVACDSEGHVHAFQRTPPPVVVFDTAGRPLRHWGEGRVVDPHGIFIDGHDKVYLIDRDGHALIVCTTTGEELLRVGSGRPEWRGCFNHPTDVAVDAAGNMYVSDGYGNHVVHKLDPKGNRLLTWGGPGGGPGEFTTPHGVWVTPDQRVLVGDRENNRIQVFSTEGAYLTAFTGVYKPMDICMDDRGVILVSDQTPALVAFSPAGEIIGRAKPMLREGHGICADREGNIFLAELYFGRVSRLRRLD